MTGIDIALIPPSQDHRIELVPWTPMRLRRALEEFVVEGMKTTIPLHQSLVRDEEFLRGEYTIKWLEQWLEKQRVAAE